MFAEKKLVIFDLDGTLIDSLDMWDRVDVEIVRRTSGTAPDPAEMEAFRKEVLREVADRKDAYVLYCGAIADRWHLNVTKETFMPSATKWRAKCSSRASPGERAP